MIRIIREEEPTKPSTRLSTDESLASLAAMRQTEPRRLMAMLRGELDWVVMKCLEKSRDRRYETASGLARDIQRYLADEPVEARPPSAWYRLGKFVKRHRTAAIASGLVLLALLVGIAGTTYGLVRARVQREKADQARAAEAEQRARAESERDKAVAINDFLTQDLLAQAEPANNAPEDHVELLLVLDRAAEHVGRRFEGRPELEAALRDTIARTYHGLASWEKAEAQWRSLLEAARRRDPRSAETYRTLGDLAHILGHRGRHDAEVLKMAEEAAAGLERTLGLDDLDTLATLNNLAIAYIGAGRLSEAIALFGRVRDAQVARLGPDHPKTLTTLNNLADAYGVAGRLPEAIALFERVRDAKVAKLGPDNPETLKTLNNLAATYWSLKQLDRSVPLFEEALRRREARLGRQHEDTQATAANLGVNYKDAGRLGDAIPLLEETYQARDRFPNNRWVGAQLLDAYTRAGRSAEAAKLSQDLLADARKTAPKGSPQLAVALARSGLALLQANAHTEAEPILRECLAIREKTQPDVWTTFNTKSQVGAALLGQKKYAEAEPLLVAGYNGMKQREATILPEGKPRLSEALERLVQFYEVTNRPDEVARWRRELEARRAAEKPSEKKP
jgi:eukaryotic-like serine/threonine-protein kinase